jgi:hypothetical protein
MAGVMTSPRSTLSGPQLHAVCAVMGSNRVPSPD